MGAEHNDQSLPELGAKLRLKQAQFVSAVHAMAEVVARDDAGSGEILFARAELGRAMRQRRSALIDLASRLVKGGRMRADSLGAIPREELHAFAVAHFGAWPARRVLEDRETYAELAKTHLPIVVSLSQAEVDMFLQAIAQSHSQ